MALRERGCNWVSVRLLPEHVYTLACALPSAAQRTVLLRADPGADPLHEEAYRCIGSKRKICHPGAAHALFSA